MENVLLVIRCAAIVLFSVQAALLAVRSVSCVKRSGPLLFAGSLLCLSLLLSFGASGTARLLLLIPALWAAGVFLEGATHGGRGGIVTGACAGALAVLLPLSLLGYGKALSFSILRGFGVALAAFFPVRALFSSWRARGSPAALFTLACAVVWLAAGAVGSFAGLADPGFLDSAPAILLSLCTGWLVFQEWYPLRSGWRGSLPALAAEEGDAGKMAERLLADEAALEWQNRMIASGVLSLGAAHEFRNILTLVKAAAQHGLSRAAPEEKDESLRLVLDHAETARRSAVESLEMLAAEGRESRRGIDAARDLPRVMGMLRPALRGQGIIIETDLAQGVVFSGRLGDIEQVIIGLVHNSAEAYKARGGGVITVMARRREGQAVIEIGDMAGGVAVDQEHRLFTPASSRHPASQKGGEGTGLGLYLSRNLVCQNGGALEYQPMEGGSVFRMSFPGEEGEPAQ